VPKTVLDRPKEHFDGRELRRQGVGDRARAVRRLVVYD